MINKFKGEYGFLSNFHNSPMQLDLGVLGKWAVDNVEQVYQAAKCADNRQAIWVLQSASPGIAKSRGKEVKMVDDWDQIKYNVMIWAVREKFKQNPDLAQKLIDTDNQVLVEGNWWGDTYWGVCKGQGHNWLGRILMKVRDEIRSQTTPTSRSTVRSSEPALSELERAGDRQDPNRCRVDKLVRYVVEKEGGVGPAKLVAKEEQG
jgi:ribA/ribD-fused uncharacterized protein